MQKLKNEIHKIKKTSSRYKSVSQNGLLYRFRVEARNDHKLIGILLIFFGLLYFSYTIFVNSKFLFKKFDPVQAEKIYSESQWQQSQNIAPDRARDEWAIKNNYSGWSNYVSVNRDKVNIKKVSDQIMSSIGKKVVSDSFLYSYVGYKYNTGANPSLLNPEHPPLAKYLIGYSIHLFGSEHVLGIGIAFASLFLIAIIVYQISGSLLFCGVAFFITSIFSLFTDQIIHGPQLELYQLFFFLLVSYIFLMAMKRKKMIFYIFAGIFFGLLLSTKTFLPFFILFSAWIIISLWKQWKPIVVVIALGLTVFIATYYQFFLQGGTLRTFLGLQKYIVIFYGNSHIPLLEFFGNYLRLIYTGSWKFWDAKRSVSMYEGWNILWPIIFTIGLGKMKYLWKKNISTQLFINFLILYNIFVCITPIFPRYLLLLFIPMIALI